MASWRMAIKNLVLDWSGTLADDFGPVLKATNEIFSHYGAPEMSAEEFREKFFLPFPKFYEKYLPQAALPELDFQYHRAFASLQSDIPLLDGAIELLEFARSRNMPCFLLSSIHPEHWKVQSRKLGVDGYFTRAYPGALDKQVAMRQLLAENNLNPRETVYIGDMVHDIQIAHATGVIACAVLTGYDSLQKLKPHAPDLLFRNLRGVLAYLKQHADESFDFPLATVGALIFRASGEVLLIRTHKWSHLWGIPGGKIRRGETAIDALHREVYEETGLRIHSVRHVLTQDCIDPPEFYKPAHFLLMNYTARCDDDQVTLNEEAWDYCWLPPQQATSRLELNTPTRLLIEHVLRK